MPLRQTSRLHIPYFLLAYGSDGSERTDDPDGLNHVLSARILKEISERSPTDVFVQCHGWLDDIPGAIAHYDEWIDSMAGLSADIAAMGSAFSPLWIGLHWPSLPWGEEEIPAPCTLMSFAANDSMQPQFLESYLDRLGLRNSLEAREALGVIFRANRTIPIVPDLPPDVDRAYRTLAELLKLKSEGIGSAPDTDMAAFDPNLALHAMQVDASPLSFSIGGSLLSPLRVLSFWNMKHRARTVGENGMHDLLKAIQSSSRSIRLHITGHSFGCIVGTSMITGPGGQQFLARPVDSLVLLQGAVSLWSFAVRIPATNGVGYYNPILQRRAVAGPVVTTQSKYDRATGVWYPAAVGLVLADPSFGARSATTSNSPPKWGAIGTWGIQGAPANDLSMEVANHEYAFEPGSVYNLQSDAFIRSGSGFEGAHGDIYGPEVAHTVWQAARLPAPRTFALEASSLRMNRKVPAPRMLSMTDERMPIPFGVQAETGRYLPGLQPRDLSHIDPFTNAVSTRGDERVANSLSTMVEVDPNNLSTAGWGVIFPAGMDSGKKASVQSALKPLLDLRSSQ